MAYESGGKFGPCRIVAGIERLSFSLRTVSTRPVATEAPKVRP